MVYSRVVLNTPGIFFRKAYAQTLVLSFITDPDVIL